MMNAAKMIAPPASSMPNMTRRLLPHHHGVCDVQHLPEVLLVTPAGATVPATAFRGEAMLLVFLRHLG